MLKKIEAIVIKKRELFHGDRELTLLTSTGIKIKVFVKGISKSKNREILAAEVLSYSEFLLNKNNIVSKISLINSFNEVKRDLKLLKNFFHTFYVLDKVIFNESIPALFRETIKALEERDRDVFPNVMRSLCEAQGIMDESITNYSKHISEHLGIDDRTRNFMTYVK